MEDPGSFEAVAYDTAKILFETVSRPDIHYRASIRNELATLEDYPGVTGSTSFGQAGEARKDLYLLKIIGDGFVELDQH